MFYAVLSFFISFALCFLLTKLRVDSLIDRRNGIQKFHTWEARRAGGIAIFISLSITCFFSEYTKEGLLILISALPVFLGGLMEDITKRISPKIRLAFAFLSGIIASIILEANLQRVDIFFVDFLLENYLLFSILFTAFALAGVSNAINIIDGFNGLAAGVVIIVFLSYSYVSYTVGDEFLLFLNLVLLGSIIGFFLWNFPRGLVFLGDSGAYILGFLAGLVGVLLVNRHTEISAWFPFTLLFYPIWETLFSALRRKIVHGSEPTEPDIRHLHSLIYRRLIKPSLRKKYSPEMENSLTSPYLWLMQLLCTVPAVLFWDNTLLLILTCISFVFLYIWLYGSIVKFKAPFLLRILMRVWIK